MKIVVIKNKPSVEISSENREKYKRVRQFIESSTPEKKFIYFPIYKSIEEVPNIIPIRKNKSHTFWTPSGYIKEIPSEIVSLEEIEVNEIKNGLLLLQTEV